MSNCQLCLDNYHRDQYRPGGTIEGRVICMFYSPKNIREIRLKIRGTEHNEWTKTESTTDSDGKSTDRSVTYSGTNRFYGLEIVLQGAGDISAGRREYRFSIGLPKDLPGSYKTCYGYIRYIIKACVDRPYKSDYRIEKILNMVAPVDLNTIKHQLHLGPVAYSEDKTTCCWCCSVGPITMNVYLQRGWFTAGETALVRVDITNLSNDNIQEVYAKIKMDIESKVTSPRSDSKTFTEVLATDTASGVGAHGRRSYDLKLRIPETTLIPNFTGCKLFEKRTQLRVTAVIPGCTGNLKIHAKIDLGHIPVDGPRRTSGFESGAAVSTDFDRYPASGQNFGQPTPGPSAPPIENASQSLPPSYEDAMAVPPKYHE